MAQRTWLHDSFDDYDKVLKPNPAAAVMVLTEMMAAVEVTLNKLGDNVERIAKLLDKMLAPPVVPAPVVAPVVAPVEESLKKKATAMSRSR